MFTTDDVCFLCKDGGDLIECDDFKHKNCDKKRRCKKVYHSYCLSYAVEDDDKEWKCPRHFCDSCGGVNLKYICKFCPLSICKSCPQAMAKKVRFISYYIKLYYVISYSVILYHIVLYCIILCYNMFHYIMFYYTILYGISFIFIFIYLNYSLVLFSSYFHFYFYSYFFLFNFEDFSSIK